MSKTVLRTVTRLQGNNAALKRGEVSTSGFELDFVDVPVLVHAFRRMVRELEFDVCEMALTTYLCAREHGVKFTALPIFLVRAFHHGAILVNRDSGISDPKQLEGKRVGVNRGYTVTTGVWARGVLQDEYGVDLSKITWVLSGDEHVEAYRAPGNVVSIEPGETIEGLLANGTLAAAINIKAENASIRPLIDNPLEAGLQAYRSRGHYPINHLVAVRDDVLESHPDAAVALFDAFTESKEQYLKKLKSGKIENPDDLDTVFSRIIEAGGNPLPYGIDANRATLEELIGHAMTQGILTKPVEIEALFAPATLTLNG
ncbi:MAG: ABC transporter substrate-binding protein [Gammaproteobacteria bacterium]|nr:ABC transporter substrate-binding protein [Gammaproteobacteria bacterium]NNC77188.1 ABC transporter substrate-binding protein [Woeseiaceae bacterium]